MTRLKDIAQRAGVTTMTASKALRDRPDVSAATKTRVKLLAQQMGYVPNSAARALRTRKTNLFGLVISSMTNPIYSRVVLAIEEGAHALGYDVLLAHTLNVPEREESCIRRFLSRGVDGLFISPVYRLANEAPIYQELLARRVPTVLLGHPAPFCSQFLNIETDDLLASYAVTQHLLKRLHPVEILHEHDLPRASLGQPGTQDRDGVGLGLIRLLRWQVEDRFPVHACEVQFHGDGLVLHQRLDAADEVERLLQRGAEFFRLVGGAADEGHGQSRRLGGPIREAGSRRGRLGARQTVQASASENRGGGSSTQELTTIDAHGLSSGPGIG